MLGLTEIIDVSDGICSSVQKKNIMCRHTVLLVGSFHLEKRLDGFPVQVRCFWSVGHISNEIGKCIVDAPQGIYQLCSKVRGRNCGLGDRVGSHRGGYGVPSCIIWRIRRERQGGASLDYFRDLDIQRRGSGDFVCDALTAVCAGSGVTAGVNTYFLLEVMVVWGYKGVVILKEIVVDLHCEEEDGTTEGRGIYK